MADNHGLYLPGSDLDGLTLEQARIRVSQAAARQHQLPTMQRPDRTVRNASDHPWSLVDKYSPQRRSTTRSALVRMQIVQLIALLGAIAAFYLAFRCGWI
jgi:hypothetical protein